MSKSLKDANKKQPSLKKQIAAKLVASLTDLKTILGEKKFNKKVRKASKILSSGAVIKPIKATKTVKKEGLSDTSESAVA